MMLLMSSMLSMSIIHSTLIFSLKWNLILENPKVDDEFS